MKRISLFLILSVCAMMSAFAQSDAKLEAESANYANCKLIDDGKYSSGQALELTDAKAKITFTYNAAEGGKYTIYVCYDGLYGAKVILALASVSSNAWLPEYLPSSISLQLA